MGEVWDITPPGSLWERATLRLEGFVSSTLVMAGEAWALRSSGLPRLLLEPWYLVWKGRAMLPVWSRSVHARKNQGPGWAERSVSGEGSFGVSWGGNSWVYFCWGAVRMPGENTPSWTWMLLVFTGWGAALMSPLLYLHSYSLLSIFLHFSYSTKASMCINHPHVVVKNMGNPDSKQLTFSQMTN